MMDICVPLPSYSGINALRCEKCGGNGKVGQRVKDSIEYNIIPCPECSGSGIGYCCEGERAEVTALLAERTIKTTETKDP